MNIILREMTVEDISQVVIIDHASFPLPWPESSYRFEVIDNMASHCWVAVLDDKIVGMLVLWLIVDEAHIATIAAHPQYRRMGIGRQLLAGALSAAKEAGATEAVLEVREANESAQALYRSFGFTITGLRENYYHDNGDDALLMSASL